MSQEIQVRNFPIVFDAKTGKLKSARFAFFEWMRPVNQVPARMIPAKKIEAEVQALNVNVGLKILNE